MPNRRADELLRAEHACRQALGANPFDPDALRSLGGIYGELGRLAEAADCYAEALKLRPGDADTWRTLGNTLYLLGRFAEAADAYRRTLRLLPDDVDGHNNLGAALADLGRLDEAIASYRRALGLRPDFADAHYNLGNTLRQQDRFAAAAACYGRALRLRPEFAQAHNNLGIALHRMGRLSEAIVSYREALRVRPDDPHALTGLGFALVESGRLVEAMAVYDEALRVAPDFPEAHRNRALALLLIDDMARGWDEYEWRLRCPGFAPPILPKPCWDGSPLDGRSILLYTEQGFGDAFQFARFAKPVQDRGGVVTLAAPASLHPLLSTCPGVDRLVPRDQPLPDFDVHCPLMSLPRVLGTTPATLPADVPYLRADPDRIEHWRREFSQYPEFKVGIAWRGSPTNPHDLARSTALRYFEPLSRVEGVRLFGLQLGPAADELRDPAHSFPVTDLGPRLSADHGTFREAAAAMANLDLVVTCCTSLAHLAGALGRPVWVALCTVPDWRWLLDREDSPWYPTARLFRQHHPGRWEEPFARMAEALQARLTRRTDDDGGLHALHVPGA